MKPYFKFIPILIYLSSFSCGKINLKPDTPNLGYYFYCKVNGVDFYPSGKDGDIWNRSLKCTYFGNAISINATNAPLLVAIGIWDLPNNIKVMNYGYDSTNYEIRGIYDKSFALDKYLSSDNININITSIDTIQKLIAGTFYFDAYNETTNDSVKVTDGKFNLYYNQ